MKLKNVYVIHFYMFGFLDKLSILCKNNNYYCIIKKKFNIWKNLLPN